MKFNLMGYCNTTGYGNVTVNVLNAATKLGHEVTFWPIGQVEVEPQYHNILSVCAGRRSTFNPNLPCLKIMHQFDLANNIGRGEMIAMPFFELDEFQDIEKYHLSKQDKLIMSSSWARGIIGQNGIEVPVFIAPLGVNRDIFHENIDLAGNPLAERQSTKFLCVGKWEVRKGHDIVCEAFNRAFTEKDNVELIMCCHNPCSHIISKTYNEEWAKMYKTSRLGDKISILGDRLESQEKIATLMASCDCGVFCSRAEAWNLELLEMMSCGKHVICTDVTGHSEFVTNQNSYIVPTEKMETAFDNTFFHGKLGKWYEIGEDQIWDLSLHMKKIHKLKSEGKLDINSHGIDTAKEFSWENTVTKIVEALSA